MFCLWCYLFLYDVTFKSVFVYFFFCFVTCQITCNVLVYVTMFCRFVKESVYDFLCVLHFYIILTRFFLKFYKAGSSYIYNHMVLIFHVELLDIIIFPSHKC